MKAQKLKLGAALWLILALLVTISCGPRPTTPAPAAPVPTPAAQKPEPTQAPVSPAPAPASTLVEKPKYGGTINVIQALASVIEVWDSAAQPRGMGAASYLVHEYFVSQDWNKGLAGTGESDWGSGAGRFENFGPGVAESWETPQIGTWVLKIRRGVHFAINPASEASKLTNGREFTADDAVWNIWRYHTDPAFPNASVRRSQPSMAKAVTVEKTGPWEVTLKAPVDPFIAWWWIVFGGNSQHLFAREAIQKYGNGSDWRNAVGTGPFIVSDLVEGNVATFVKNPNYWYKNPAGPGKGDQLPYVDTVKILIVPDVSTRLAAMRTSRADWVTEVEWEDAEGLIKTNPKLSYKRYLPAGMGIYMRQDKTDLPFKDKRVRQALMMATDFEAMKNDLYKGQAEILIYPVPPSFDWLWVPTKDLPESVRTLYKYNPERARQLLAEAGYPKGFKTKMIVQNISREIDPAAVFKAMWAKVGVDVELQPREAAVYSSILSGTQEETIFRTINASITTIMALSGFRGVTTTINDPFVEETFQEMQKHIIINQPKADELYRKLVPHVMEQSYIIPRPTPYSYTFWQPWVKNHYGETSLFLWLRPVWIDQDLKEKMTGRR